jgi:hypothetical protein
MAKRRQSRGVGEGLLRTTPRPDSIPALGETISGLVHLDANGLCLQWRNHLGGSPPAHLSRWLLLRILVYRIQAAALGGLDKETLRVLRQPKGQRLEASDARRFRLGAIWLEAVSAAMIEMQTCLYETFIGLATGILFARETGLMRL